MNTIDRAALIEASAAVLDDSYARWCDRVEAEQVVPETEHEAMAEAVLPVIAAGLLAPLRELHYDVVAYADFAMTTGRRECVCGKSDCLTARLLDQIEADAKGGE